VVKINTRKGKTPLMITMSTSPNTKQLSASKGFGLGNGRGGASRGVINASLEYTKSVSDPLSPYTAYDRKQLSLSWFNLLNSGIFASAPLRITIGATGNLGGRNTTADPDALQNTWTIASDNAVRGNLSLNWLLSKSWITNLELNASVSYGDKYTRENSFYSSASNKIVLHGTEKGFFMAEPYNPGASQAVLSIPYGEWFNEMRDDDRPLSSKVTLKASWARNFGKINNKIKLGADWSQDCNFGIGAWTPELATAPSFREYRYCDNPAMHNIGAYLEDNILIPIGKGRLNLIAGIRNDNTYIKGSDYGLTSSFSPRFNAKYTVFQAGSRRSKALRELSFRASWGIAVKLPSFSVLFPIPTYRDVRVFTSTTNSSNESFSAYYIEPRRITYNPELRWQSNRLSEIGMEMDLLGTKISLAGFWNRTFNAYTLADEYYRTSYAYTPDSMLSGLPIPADDRIYSIDRVSGIVTVSDRTGRQPSQQLGYQTYKELAHNLKPDNEQTPIDRYGVEWVVDFTPIKAIGTSIRLDGTWYAYRSLKSNVVAYSPATQRSAQDGMPYPYIGFYYGDNSYSNGSESATLRNNITVTTHIPRVRLIITLKLESTLLRYSRTLSERTDGSELAKVISDRQDILSTTGESIYDGDNFAVRYPEYYCSYDDPTPRNYLEDLKAARENHDDKLFNDLWQLAYKSNYLYTFAKDYISPYFSANLSITKEIGDIASISFYANNFFNNQAQVWSTRTQTYLSPSNYIPRFQYGLTLRLKF
ncbi:MAG: TonB-dependent receptor, partial [Bacteroidales bacterium]|nr:TonB-dependent receptor [Bacteroidales bacterium]